MTESPREQYRRQQAARIAALRRLFSAQQEFVGGSGTLREVLGAISECRESAGADGAIQETIRAASRGLPFPEGL